MTGSPEGTPHPHLDLLRDLEEALLKIPQVRKAQVTGSSDNRPLEIHVVTSSARSPKQTVRDVQSLAAAAFGVRIDHRIVSVVQIDDGADEGPKRVVVERVGIGTRSGSEWVEVELRWPGGETGQGSSAAGSSRESRAKAAATAALEGLDKVLGTHEVTVELESIAIHKTGTTDWVLVHSAYHDKTGSTRLMGHALILDDIATAAARALLDSVNRKLRLG